MLKGALTAGVVVPVAAMNAGMKSIGVGAQTRKDVIPGMVGGTVGAGVRAGVRMCLKNQTYFFERYMI